MKQFAPDVRASLILYALLCNFGVLAQSEIAPPVFSHPSGFYQDAFTLELTAAEPGDVILYTLDGSEPLPDHIGGTTFTYKNQYPNSPGDPFGDTLISGIETFEYGSPLSIYDRSSEPDKVSQKSSTNDFIPVYFPTAPSFKGTAVRARTLREGAGMSAVVSRSYFVTEEGGDRYQIPVVSLALGENILFDYEDGMANAGITFDQARLVLPDLPTLPHRRNNFWRRGAEWEFQSHFALMVPGQDTAVLNHECGVRIHGSSSRRWPRKSFRIYSRSDYGTSRFEYPFFAEQTDDSFNRLILHNGGGDQPRANMRDPVGQRIFRPLGWQTQDAQPAIIFVNGEYYGVNSIRERYDRHYFERRRGIQEADFEMYKDGELTDGDTLFLHEVTSFVEENDLSDDEAFEIFASMVNTASMIDIFAGNFFIRNTDWLSNNTLMFRNSNPNAWPDNRWEFAVVDLDQGWLNTAQPDQVSYNLLSEVINGLQQGDSTVMTKTGAPADFFRACVQNEGFRNDFVNRFADLMNTLLLPERCMAIFNDYAAEISPYMPEHRLRWHNTSSLSGWAAHIEKIHLFSIERPFHQRNHLEETFNLDGQFELNLDVSDTEHGYIRINTVDINPGTAGVAEAPYPWSGIYFKGVPVEITATAYPGFQFAGWEGDTETADAQFTAAFDANDVSLKALFIEDDAAPAVPLHYWHFNDLTANIRSVSADVSAGGTATLSYPGSGDGYMDEVNDGTEINARFDHPPGKGLRVRNPSDERELIAVAPTSGYENVKLSYAAKRTNNGSEQQAVYYRTQPDGPWIFLSEEQVFVDYLLFEFDLSEAPDAADNPNFAVRILFTGETAAGDNGNNRFDNFLIEGTPIEGWERPLLPLQETTYTLSGWAQHNFPGSYPEYMRFYWSDDPSGEDYDITAPGSAPYDCGYDLDTRPRINGLGEAGFSFISTTNPQYDFCAADSAAPHRYTGSAEIGINTQGAAHGRVSWTARLITEGARTFAVRLQYRTDTAEAFQNFEAPTVFSSQGKAEGDTAAFSLQLPQDLLGLPELYLRWVYYQEEGEIGNRPEIAVDDIEICPCEPLGTRQGSRPEALAAYPNPTDETVTLVLEGMEGPAEIFVRDLFGKTVLRSRANPGDKTREVNLGTLAPGVYLISVETQRNNAVVKVVKKR